MARSRLLVLLETSIILSLTAAASPCAVSNLPEQIQSSMTSDYGEWKIVTPGLLEASDRATWLENYSKDCPGIIKGKFDGNDREGFVLNLVRRASGSTRQQVVFFRPNELGFTSVVIFRSAAVPIVTVIRKLAPGRYKSAGGNKSILIKTDTIGISQIGAWTEVYYWDGANFRRIVTSE